MAREPEPEPEEPDARQCQVAWELAQQYRGLVEGQAFSHTFQTEGQYERLVPAEWREALSSASTVELGRMPEGEVPAGAPSSLAAFITSAYQCQLAQLSRPEQRASPLSPLVTPSGKKGQQRWRQGAGPKKVTECMHLGARVQQLAAAAGSSAAIDIGCGKGYLSSFLAAGGLRVLALDGRAALTSAATATAGAESDQARPAAAAAGVPTYVAMRLGEGGSNGGGEKGDGGCRTCSVAEASEEIPQLLRQHCGIGGREAEAAPGAVVVALHACGALSNSCLELCVKAASAGWLDGAIICGCCYGLLEEPQDWPRSEAMRRIVTLQQESQQCGPSSSILLGVVLRDKACHAVSSLAEDPSAWARKVALSSGYRAALWAAAAHFGHPELGHLPPLPPVKQTGGAASLPRFRQARTNKLLRSQRPPDFGAWAAPILQEWQQAAAAEGGQRPQDEHRPLLPTAEQLSWFYHDESTGIRRACTEEIFALEALAACLWPVLETLIVLDRLQHTREMLMGQQARGDRWGATAEELFPPAASPRNWGIVLSRR